MKEDNFVYMLIALVLFLVGQPVLGYLHIIPDALEMPIASILLLGIGVWSLADSKVTFRIGMTFALLGIVASVVAAYNEQTTYKLLSVAALFCFLLLSTRSAFIQIAFGEKLNLNRLLGAVCVYLLLGALWSTLYSSLHQVSPESFSGAVSTEAGAGQWVYYSFVTLTTLGYGDILPVSPAARALAYAEAIIGVFYMAVLVAMLVSAYAADRQKDT